MEIKLTPNKRIYIIATIAIAAGFLAACSSNTDTNSAQRIVEVNPTHQGCETNRDCGLIYVDCSACGCGVPINIQYQEHYLNLYKQLCQDYRGPVCEVYCPPVNLVCRSQRCEAELLE